MDPFVDPKLWHQQIGQIGVSKNCEHIFFSRPKHLPHIWVKSWCNFSGPRFGTSNGSRFSPGWRLGSVSQDKKGGLEKFPSLTWTIHSCRNHMLDLTSLFIKVSRSMFLQHWFKRYFKIWFTRYIISLYIYIYRSIINYSRYPRNGTLNIKIHPEINRCPPLRLAMRCNPHGDSWRANNSNSLTPYVLCFFFLCGFTMVLSWGYYGFIVGLWLLFDGLWWF